MDLLARQAADVLERNSAEEALKEVQQDLQRHACNLEMMVSERTARLRETVQDLEAFSYSIAHDLRAPLRAMQSFGWLLLPSNRNRAAEAGSGLSCPAANSSAVKGLR